LTSSVVSDVWAGTCNPNAASNSFGQPSNAPGQNGNICVNADGSTATAGASTDTPVFDTSPQPISQQPTPSPTGSVAAYGIDPNTTTGGNPNPLYGAQFNTNALGANTPTILGNSTGQTSIYSGGTGVNFYGPTPGVGVQLHNIAPGTAGTDAVNLDQLNAAINGAFDGAYKSALKQGLASVAAMSNVPRLDRDKMFSLGIGFGGVGGESAYAAGAALRLSENIIVNGTVGRAFGSNSIMSTTTWGAGAAIGW